MYSGPIYAAMQRFFEEDNWSFHAVDEMPILGMAFTGKNGKWMCYAQAREDQQQFVFYSVCPINTPTDKLGKIAEFITRANYGMIIGNFELDYNDGEVRYKTSIDVEGAELTSALVKQMVYANVLIMDRYLNGLMAVIYGNANPADEVNRIEGRTPQSGASDDTDEDSSSDSEQINPNIVSQIQDLLSNIERQIGSDIEQSLADDDPDDSDK